MVDDPHRDHIDRSSSPPCPADDFAFPAGFHYLPGYLSTPSQLALLSDVRKVLDDAPLFEQAMPRTGAPLSVCMSNAGEFGWVTDRDGGYRYQTAHPVTGKPWPAIPRSLLNLWSQTTSESEAPNLCLINYYDQEARLGLHQDRGDSSLAAPVVSISLGDEATFLLGGMLRKNPVRRLALRSGAAPRTRRSDSPSLSRTSAARSPTMSAGSKNQLCGSSPSDIEPLASGCLATSDTRARLMMFGS